ncbi:baeRF3 domain-containing protein [Streptomyces albidochromogenes]|uniref:Chemotaxis protein n=1 Tax=Streptomyces albidochromogenes TaxID=329524 RepID=A0ABW6FTJ5_9ACTN
MTQPTRPTPELLAELRKPRPYPAVSVTLPTHRHWPESQQDHIRLRNLLTEAEKRLADDPEVSKATASAVSQQLAAAADALDPEYFGDGLVVYASPEEHRSFLVGGSVPERIVINTTYLTRNLVALAAREREYLVLVLSTGEVRLWRGRGEEVTEDVDSGYPVITSGAERDGAPSRDGGQWASQDFRNMLAEADRKLTAVLQGNRLPVVLVGLPQQIAAYREVSHHGQALAGELESGGLLNTTPAEMSAQLAPVRRALADADTARAMRGLDEARSGKRYSAGVQDVWQAAGEGRVALLVVEEGLRVTARPETVEGAERATLTLQAPGEESSPGMEDDIIDSVVETVLSADGEVIFVPDESLADAHGIAAALRY